MIYLQSKKFLPLILKADGKGISLYIDRAHTIYAYMRGMQEYIPQWEQELCMYLVQPRVRSTETEVISVGKKLPKHLWLGNVVVEQSGDPSQVHVLYQDNKSTILLQNNGRLSCRKGSKQFHIRYFFNFNWKSNLTSHNWTTWQAHKSWQLNNLHGAAAKLVSGAPRKVSYVFLLRACRRDKDSDSLDGLDLFGKSLSSLFSSSLHMYRVLHYLSVVVSCLSLYFWLLVLVGTNSWLIPYAVWHCCLLSLHYWGWLCCSLKHIVWVDLLSDFLCSVPYEKETKPSLGILHDTEDHIVFVLLLLLLLFWSEYGLVDCEHLHCAVPII